MEHVSFPLSLLQQYEDAVNQFSEKKKEKKDANNALKTIKGHYQPIKDQHMAQESAVERYKGAAHESMKGGRVMENKLRDEQEKLSSLEDKVDEPRQELENAKREEAARKNKIENLQREIEVS
jgi:chromosome segregation ATPase